MAETDDHDASAPAAARRVAPRRRQRRFAREVGSIVLGVLIALGIGEVAEALRWRARAAATTRALNAEIARNAGSAEERTLLQPCFERRIGEIRALVRAARRSGRLPAIGEFGRTPIRPIEYAAWDVAVGSGTTLHLDPRYRTVLAINYPVARNFPDFVAAEQELWARLRTIQDAAGPVSDGLLTDAATTVETLRYRAGFNGMIARQLVAFARNLGIAPTYEVVLGPDGTRAMLAADVARRQICQPLIVDGRPSPRRVRRADRHAACCQRPFSSCFQ